jgi:hypothetical protein
MHPSVVAAAAAGRHWRDLRFGWAVAHGDAVTRNATQRASWRALVACSLAGETLVTSDDVSAIAGLPAAQLEAAWEQMYDYRQVHDTPLVRVGRPGSRRWAAYARIGAVAQPADAETVHALRDLVGMAAQPVSGAPATEQVEVWWLLGSWLRVTVDSARDSARAAVPLSLPARDLV